VVQALRHLLENHPDQSMAALNAYDKPNQDVLISLMSLTASVGGGNLQSASPLEVAHLLDQLTDLEEALRPRAPLAIANMCFCRGGRDFGVFDPLPPDHAFRAASAGVPADIIHIYAEPRNLTVRRNGEFYEIAVMSRMVVKDAEGKTVYNRAEPERQHYRSSRRDFYLRGRYEIPPELRPGGYTLTVEVEDLFSQPARPPARQSLDFQVIAGGTHGR
jgi:hypothetical protein